MATSKMAEQHASRELQTHADASAAISGWEWFWLALVIAVAAFLRFGRWGLLEFKGDEAIALRLALDFVEHGRVPLAGLMSSVGVTNPPLFTYLLIPVVAINPHVEF